MERKERKEMAREKEHEEKKNKKEINSYLFEGKGKKKKGD